MRHLLSPASVLLLALLPSPVFSEPLDLSDGKNNTRLLENVDATFGESPAPFNIKVDTDFIHAQRELVRWTRIPRPIEGLEPDDSDGPILANFTRVRDYWVNEYDWDSVQASINQQLTQFTTTVQLTESNYTWPLPLHFVHHRSSRADAIPFLFLHGWPGSFLEVRHIIDKLTTPNDDTVPAVHVIAPSLPGFGFSPAPTHAGFGPREAAQAFHGLMEQLVYAKYVIQGGDFGGVILRYQAQLYPSHVVSVLDNFWITQPNATDVTRFDANETTADETAYIERLNDLIVYRSGYRLVQQNIPLTLAYPLTASPIGFAMWIYSLMKEAIDHRIFDFTAEEIITWALMYVIQGPYGGLRIYKESQREGAFGETGFGSFPYVEQPVAISEFPYDIWYGLPLDWAQRSGNVIERYLHDYGGHFAA